MLRRLFPNENPNSRRRKDSDMIYVLFVLGLVLLVAGSNFFVDSAVRIAKRFHVSELVIGMTLVSIGTTLPEVMVSTTASVLGHNEMALGNALGSIICNTAFIAGISQTLRPGKVNLKDMRNSCIWFFASLLFVLLVGLIFGQIPRWAGAVLAVLFCLYSWFSVRNGTTDEEEEEGEGKKVALPVDILLLIGGAALLFVGARLLVDKGSEIARMMNVPEKVISLSLIALGTSLPELVTTITSLVKGHAALGLGNVIGANILNIVLVCGVSALIHPVPMAATSLSVDVPVGLGVMAILTIPTLIQKKVLRYQGILLLCVYVGYLIYLF